MVKLVEVKGGIQQIPLPYCQQDPFLHITSDSSQTLRVSINQYVPLNAQIATLWYSPVTAGSLPPQGKCFLPQQTVRAKSYSDHPLFP